MELASYIIIKIINEPAELDKDTYSTHNIYTYIHIIYIIVIYTVTVHACIYTEFNNNNNNNHHDMHIDSAVQLKQQLWSQ